MKYLYDLPKEVYDEVIRKLPFDRLHIYEHFNKNVNPHYYAAMFNDKLFEGLYYTAHQLEKLICFYWKEEDIIWLYPGIKTLRKYDTKEN